MHLQFFDHPEDHLSLLPLTYTRPVSELRIGIFTIREKWLRFLQPESFSYSTPEYLSGKYSNRAGDSDLLKINGSILPDDTLVKAVNGLAVGESLFQSGLLIASKGSSSRRSLDYTHELSRIKHPWDIFRKNGEEIRKDIRWVKPSCTSRVEDIHTIVYGEEVYIEAGAKIRAAILNTENGPIYIGKNAEVQEGSIIRGPFALCEGSTISLGGKMRPDSTVGPFSKVGGEFSNSVILGYSNKAHDGFIGNSVIGEWCNLGAGTNNSNLKNSYGEVKVWDYLSKSAVQTGLQFCGIVMGDHTKCGINTMFNTGTSVGLSCNIFGSGFPPTVIPSFSWGGNSGFSTYRFAEALETARKVCLRRGYTINEEEEAILHHVFSETLDQRH